MPSPAVCVLFTLFLFPLLTYSADVGPSAAPANVSAYSHQIVDELYRDMLARWEALDAACDPNAVFALTYIYMTYGVKMFNHMSYFDDGNAMANMTVHFAGRYMAAYDAYAARNFSEVSGPWMSAFNWAASGRSNATENLLLGMSAHINYDLAITTFEVGFNTLEKKPDYDRINDLLGKVMYNISMDLGERYDPSLLPSPIDGIVLPLIISWRANAWTNSVLYKLSLLTDLLIAVHEIAATTATILFQPLRFSNTTSARVAYCEAHHMPSKLD
jgi:hypothetical protein